MAAVKTDEIQKNEETHEDTKDVDEKNIEDGQSDGTKAKKKKKKKNKAGKRSSRVDNHVCGLFVSRFSSVLSHISVDIFF